jgi:hypothetical protein
MVKASFVPGTLYAIHGLNDWIYYGQVTATKSFGFFRYRSREIVAADVVLANEIMSNVSVWLATVGQALRQGVWVKIGKYPLHPALTGPRSNVIWSQMAGPNDKVEVWTEQPNVKPRDQRDDYYHTTVDDPAIQNLEVAAAWGAVDHIPKRLEADFGAEPGEWYIGGPIWRERRYRAELVRRAQARSAGLYIDP